MRLNDEDQLAWERRRYAPYPRWRRGPAGFYLYVSKHSHWESVGRKQDGKWRARDQAFERLDDALRFAEVAYYLRRADQIEACTPSEFCY
jgi:hypothetical protein